MNNFNQHNDLVFAQVKATVNVFLNQVYGWMSVGLILTAFVAWYASESPAMLNLFFTPKGLSGFAWLLIIAQLGLVFVLSGMINRLSGSTATMLFMIYSILTGLTLTPIFIVYTQSSIAVVFFIAASMFAALSLYGYTTKRDLSAMGRFLFMALIGIVVASIANIFIRSQGMQSAISYLGVFVFAGLTAYDTQKLKEFGNQLSQDDSSYFRRYVILGALTLYLDFINLFLMLLRILGDRK